MTKDDDLTVWPIDPEARQPREAVGFEQPRKQARPTEPGPHQDLVDRIDREREELLRAAEGLRRPLERVDQVQHVVMTTARHLPLIVIGGSLLMGTLWLTGRWKPPPLRTVLALAVQGLSLVRAFRAATGSGRPPTPQA